MQQMKKTSVITQFISQSVINRWPSSVTPCRALTSDPIKVVLLSRVIVTARSLLKITFTFEEEKQKLLYPLYGNSHLKCYAFYVALEHFTCENAQFVCEM